MERVDATGIPIMPLVASKVMGSPTLMVTRLGGWLRQNLTRSLPVSTIHLRVTIRHEIPSSRRPLTDIHWRTPDDRSWPKAAGPLSVANEAERTLLSGRCRGRSRPNPAGKPSIEWSRNRTSSATCLRRIRRRRSRTGYGNDCSKADIGLRQSAMVSGIVNEVRAINLSSFIDLHGFPTIEWE
jgi:hypothetical protein